MPKQEQYFIDTHSNPMITFTIPGTPRGKGRPRAAKRGNHIGMYTPKETVSYENLIKIKAQEAMRGGSLISGGVLVYLNIEVKIPDSWSAKKKKSALMMEFYPTTKPDADNVIKAVFDGMNGIVYGDDKQVCHISAIKIYSLTPQVKVTISELK